MALQKTLQPPARPLTGRKVALVFGCFFGTIFAADAFLVTSAIRTWSGTEATSAYKAGQLYNGELALARAQAARGWTLALGAEREADGSVRLTVNARDGAGGPLAGRTLDVVLQRPTDQREDRKVTLAEGEAGAYMAVIEGIAPGQWDVVADVVERGERIFRRRTRTVLR
ncbi:MAG TPA: FixH family protein [Microvirga sp.]|jgi:nitrogen fixation protein FixH